MGLISGVLLLPLAPVRATSWVADLLLEQAQQEIYGPEAIRAGLADLNRAYEQGAIGEEEFEAEEDRLLDLLERSQDMAKAGYESRRDG